MKRSRVLLAAILVLTHGAFLAFGWRRGVTAGRTLGSIDAASKLELSEEVARTQFQVGPHPAARDALLRQLDLLNHLEPSEVLRKEDLTSIRILTLLRLSNVEMAMGDTQKASEYRAQADSTCTDAQWRDCSDAALQRLLLAR